MKKIPTLFSKTYWGDEYIGVSNQWNEEIDGLDDYINNGWKNVVATVKYDGSSCYIHNDWIYRRYDNKPRYDKEGNLKEKKKLPSGSILCDTSVPPHEIYWIPCDKNNPQDKFYFDAFEAYREDVAQNSRLPFNEWTFEIIGKKFQSNPYELDNNILIPHGCTRAKVRMTYRSVLDWLYNHNSEGLVFWEVDEDDNLIKPIAKIRRKDFNMEWPMKKEGEEDEQHTT